MFVAVVFGCVAQFYPSPFPDNRGLLALCVVAYFGISAVLQYQISLGDRDFVWAARAGVSAGVLLGGDTPPRCLRAGPNAPGCSDGQPARAPLHQPHYPLLPPPTLRPRSRARRPCLCAPCWTSTATG